jgi:hypothetical protein
MYKLFDRKETNTVYEVLRVCNICFEEISGWSGRFLTGSWWVHGGTHIQYLKWNMMINPGGF